ncbi:putative amino acid permease YhdG [compost metagenome]
MVALAVIVMRKKAPDVPRTFKVPLVPALPIAGIAINLYLMSGLSAFTWMTFGLWLLAGVAIYFLWGRQSASKVFDASHEDEPVEPILSGTGP